MPKFSFRRADHGFAFRIPVVALLVLVSLCRPLRATGPVFQVKKTVTLADLYAQAPNRPLFLSGLSTSGSMAGYYVHHIQPGNGRTFGAYTHAFVWDALTPQLLDLNGALQAQSSLATCMSPGGVVAGVGWTAGNPDNSIPQFGFVWSQGVAHTFSSPGSTSIDAVVAVNDSGQVIGTYYAASSPYKRAFLWDGTASTDLGDLGDPDNSFIWPKAINNAGQVVGTVYTYDETGLPQGASAFLWQQPAGIGSIDGDGDFAPSYGVGINAAGEIVCAYDQPNIVNPALPLASGFQWADDLLTVLAPLASKKGLTPFAINDAGQIIGTAYAADSTLHLFTWEAAGTAVTTDQGKVALNTGDTAFRLTGINSGGNAVGFVTDASNHAQAVWRLLHEPAGTMHNVAAMLPAGVTFVADATGGTTVLVNEAGRVACTGYNGAGQAVMLLLLPDSDGDGMTDEWEMAHNLNPYDDTDASGDADGDGLTNLQEFQQGSDPNDFYNGQIPTVTSISGGDQVGNPGTVLLNPLVVQLAKPNATPWANAVVTFSLSQGGGGLAATSNGTPDTSITVRTNGSGVASVYFKLPGDTCAISEITVSAGAAQPVTFRARTVDDSGNAVTPSAPSDINVVLNADGSTDTTWTNNTTSTADIPIYVKAPNGNWVFIKNVPAGSTSVHITEAELPW